MCSYDRLKKAVGVVLRAIGENVAPEGELVAQLARETGIDERLVRPALARMESENLLLIADGTVFLIA